jgi:hypothetical protein
MVNDKKIEEILDRGNTAEVKKTRDGVIILEVSRKIRYDENNDEGKTRNSGKHSSG